MNFSNLAQKLEHKSADEILKVLNSLELPGGNPIGFSERKHKTFKLHPEFVRGFECCHDAWTKALECATTNSAQNSSQVVDEPQTKGQDTQDAKLTFKPHELYDAIHGIIYAEQRNDYIVGWLGEKAKELYTVTNSEGANAVSKFNQILGLEPENVECPDKFGYHQVESKLDSILEKLNEISNNTNPYPKGSITVGNAAPRPTEQSEKKEMDAMTWELIIPPYGRVSFSLGKPCIWREFKKSIPKLIIALASKLDEESK